MKLSYKRVRSLADGTKLFFTYLATFIVSIILLGIFVYVFSQGFSRLSWNLITSDYHEEMETIRVEDSAGSFDNPELKNVFFSYHYGIGVENGTTTDGEHCVVLAYIAKDSPFRNAISNRTEEKIDLEIGSRLTIFTGITNENEVVFTKNSYNAEEFVKTMDQSVAIISVQCKVGGGGIRGSLLTTLLLIIVTLVIALPLGIMASIYLVEYGKESKIKRIVQTLIDMTSGIPSIIFGFCGALIFLPFVGNIFQAEGYTIMAGALTMVIVLLPTIIKTTSETLMIIPKDYTMASLALGASKTQTIFKVILPNAVPGILTATLLSVGRIIGESAALIFVMGTSISDRVDLFGSSTSLSLHIWSIVGGENPNYKTACAISIIILVMVLILSILVKLASKKINKLVK